MNIRHLLIAGMLLSVVTINGQHLESGYLRYQMSFGMQKTENADKLFEHAYRLELTDTLFRTEALPNDSTRNFLVNSVMQDYFYRQNRFDQACQCGQRAIAFYNQDIDDITYAKCLNTFAAIHQSTGNFSDAMHYQHECIKIDLRSGNEEELSSSLNALAAMYLTARQPSEALTTIGQAIHIERKLGNNERLAVRLGIAAQAYKKLHQPDKALSVAQEAYRLDLNSGRKAQAAIHAIQIASIFIDMGMYNAASQMVDKALPQLREDNNRHYLAIAYHLHGQIAAQNNNIRQAEKDYQTAIGMASFTRSKYIEKNCLYSIYQLYRNNDINRAMPALERYVQLSDSLYNEEVANMQNLYLAKYKTTQLRAHNLSLSETNAQQQRANMWLKILTVALGLLLVSALLQSIYLFRKRTRNIRQMRELTVARTHFFTNLTHEFRTPLTVINGMSQQIADGHITDDNELQKAATAINRQGQRVIHLNNQILDVGKLQTSLADPHFRHDNILPILAMIVESYLPYAGIRQVTLQYRHPDNPIVFDFDPDYMRKLITNLLSNALKFTHAGGTITLAITQHDEQHIGITVADTGEGIAPEVMPHIFDLFFQGHTNSRTIGTGIGLSLSKEIVDVLRGTISVDSKLGEGTTFTIILPQRQGRKEYPPIAQKESLPPLPTYQFDEGEQPDDAELEEEKPTDTTPTVLVVEDNADVSSYINSLLRNDYTLIFAADGKEGLQKAQQTIPDLIITDLMMPLLSGEELLNTVRSTETISHIPIIIITAKAEQTHRINAFDKGADAYLTKPFNADELSVRVQQLIVQRRNLRETFAFALRRGIEKEIVLNDTDRTFLTRLQDTVHHLLREGTLTVDNVASEMCLSNRQLLRKVQALTGETTVQYILHLRLQLARRLLLEHPSALVSEIAIKCGFEEVAHFSKKFKQMYQITPSELRAANNKV